MSALAITWPAEHNEHGDSMLWFGSWLVGTEGAEGPWFYSGRGGDRGQYPVPAEATGVRIRRWPNEGFDAEYVDVFDLAGQQEIGPATLDFDQPQRFSMLAKDVE